MPPKKAASKKAVGKQQFIYIVQDTSDNATDLVVDSGSPDSSNSNIYRVHTDLDAANDDAEAHFIHWRPLGHEYAEKTYDEYDGTLCIQHGSEDYGYDVTRVVKKDLFGGVIQPLKEPGTKKKKAAPPSKKKAKPAESDEFSGSAEEDHDDDDDDDEVGDDGDGDSGVTSSMVHSSAARAGSKRKSLATTVDLDDEDSNDESVASSPPPASVGGHFAPAGQGNCLADFSFFVSGTLNPWTHDQADALIKFFGGTISSKIKPDLDYVVLGSKPGPLKLIELKKPEYKNVKRLNQGELYDLISTTPGDGSYKSKEDVTAACKAAKKPPKKAPAKKAKA